MKKFLVLGSVFLLFLGTAGTVYGFPYADATVMEPATILFFGTGLIGLTTIIRRSLNFKE